MMTEWELFEAVLKARVGRIMAMGPPGLGKSYTPYAVAKENGWEFYSITLTDQTPMSELRGHFILKGNDFVWHDGVIARAWRRSHECTVVLELNEVVEASSDAEVFLHNALDDPEFARMDLPTGETLRPSKDNLIVVGTMNGKMIHLREALRDRFPVAIEVETPHPKALEALPQDLQGFAAIATGSAAGPDRMSIRPIAAFAGLREKLGYENAARAVWGKNSEQVLAAISKYGVKKAKAK